MYVHTDSFVSDDPCVYDSVCYEMMVGKVYYALVAHPLSSPPPTKWPRHALFIFLRFP